MKAIIIAGGPGTRLRPLTYHTPKPIISLCNKPFLMYQIESLKKHGITQIILNLHYKSEEVQKLLGNGEKLGVHIEYSLEDQPLDTAGAVKLAQEYFDSDPLLVLNGDILTDLDYSALIEFHKQHHSELTFTLTHVEDPSAYGLIVTDAQTHRVKQFLEKPKPSEATVNTVNAGTYVINPELFEYVPAKLKYSFERQLFPQMLNLGKKMYGFDNHSYWMDIGTPRKYFQAHIDLLASKVSDKTLPGSPLGKNYQGEGCEIDPTAQINAPSILGNQVKIGAQSKISGYSSIGHQVKIGNNVTLKHCILLDQVTIEDNCILEQCIVGQNSIIQADSHLPKNFVIPPDTQLGKGCKLL